MDSATRNELSSIQTELNSIISELESISAGVRKDFVGIGQDTCADVIDRAISNLKTGRTRLQNVNGNNLADWAIPKVKEEAKG